MLKVQKIEDKELVLVQGQKNCSVKDKPTAYAGQGDCLTDCGDIYGEPKYYMSAHY